MKLCLRLLMPAGVLLLVLSTIAAACGGDEEELTLEEFFQQGDAIDDDYGERFDRLPDEYPDPDPEDLQVFEAFYGEYAVLFAELIDELETLNPPSEAEGAFDELLTAGSEYGGICQISGLERYRGILKGEKPTHFVSEGGRREARIRALAAPEP